MRGCGQRGRTYGNVNNVDNIVGQFSGVIGRQIITAAFNEQELAAKFSLQSFQSAHIGANVFSDCGVRTSSCLDGEDAIFWKSLVFYQEFLVLTSEDVVGDGSFSRPLASV
jgi:hypothetical protein